MTLDKESCTVDDMFCKSQLITCNRVKECNGVCPFEDALKHADQNDEVYCLTSYGVLLSVMRDYGIDVCHITPKMAEHLFDDFMDALCKQGYAERKGGDTD